MKSSIVLGLLASLGATQQFQSGREDLDGGKTREQIGHKVVPGGTAPRMQTLTPRLTKYHSGAKRTKVRYGPYTLIPNTKRGFSTSGEMGMTMRIEAMARPCTGRCNLLLATSDLEWANGTQATNQDGAWLHHIVFTALGQGHKDSTCPIGVLPGERFFSSGNERTPTSFGDVLMTSPNKIKSAFPLKPADSLFAQFELMNITPVEKRGIYLVVDWEWFAPSAADEKVWKRARAMWLDITGCGASSKGVPANKRVFDYGWSWTSTFNGDMLGVGGHLHDGGTQLDVMKNSNVICASKPTYKVGGHSHKKRSTGLSRRDGPSTDGKLHISTMTTCTNMGRMAKGDKISIKAMYDFNKHEGMKTGPTSSRYAPIMGIAILYAAEDV